MNKSSVQSSSKRTNKKKPRPSRFPPQINMKPVQSRVIRFRALDTKTDYAITRFNLLKLMTAVGSTNVTGVTIWTGVKLRHIEMWGVSGVETGTPISGFVSCSVEWQASRGPSKLATATGNLNQPAHLNAAPPKESLAGFWSQVADGTTVNNEVLFYLSCPEGTILDLHLSYVEANGSTTTPIETLTVTYVVAPNVYGVYFNRLDSQVPGYELQPVDVQEARCT